MKTNAGPKPGGGKGRLALDWWIRQDCPAEFYALVDLSEERIWLLSQKDLSMVAQQNPKGRYHFYMYVDSEVKSRTGKRNTVADFSAYLLERRVDKQLSRS